MCPDYCHGVDIRSTSNLRDVEPLLRDAGGDHDVELARAERRQRRLLLLLRHALLLALAAALPDEHSAALT